MSARWQKIIIGGLLITGALVGWLVFTLSAPVTPSMTTVMTESEIQELYGPLLPIYFGQVQMRASVADTPLSRQQGLSNTPSLPTGIVKLFVLEEPGPAPFWMKDMNYPIDILWLDSDKTIIYIAPDVAPETYPQTFGPLVDSLYVIETPAGFADRAGMVVGEQFVW